MKKQLLVSLFLVGCGAQDPGSPGSPESIEQPLGEVVGDRPSYVERLALYACDAARADPSATGWSTYKAVPPLLWDDRLGQSGRAHSQDMHDNGCFQHPSCDGTDPFVRIQTFWTTPSITMGENIAAGVSDGQTVITNWINEIGAAPGETGHRDNMFNWNPQTMSANPYTHVGFGYVAGGKMAQLQGYWTQDFVGVSPAPPIPPVPAGSHFPQSTVAGGTVNFGAIYYDAGGVAPDRVEVQVDNTTFPLTLAHGTASAGAYVGLGKVPAGCHRYYFRAVVAGKGSIYPDNGTLGVASSDTSGCADYVAGGVTPDAPVGGGSGGCSVANSRSPTGISLLGLLLLLGLAARRRR